MGTRATIKIEGVKFAKVYKHFDGYPEGTLPFLEAFNKKFEENRGNDPEYKFAQLLRETVRSGEGFHLDMNEYTGWGVIPYNGYKEEYEYILNNDGSVTVNSF